MSEPETRNAKRETRSAQTAAERAALSGDVASRALNDALRVSFRLLKLAMLLVALLFLGSGIFTVKQHERAFILRFGRAVQFTDPVKGTLTPIVGPGLHFAWPFLIDEVVRFPQQRELQLLVSSFWYKEPPEGEKVSAPPSLAPGEGGYNLTGDANILHSRWTVRYTVTDPVRFFDTLGDPAELASDESGTTVRKLLTHLTESAVIRTMARYKVDDAYRGQRAKIEEDVQKALVAQLESCETDFGITINRVAMEDITPPLQARKAFDDVTIAGEESRKLVAAARGYKSKTEIEAVGKAARVLADARAYATQLVADAQADASYMSELLKQYPTDRKMLSHFLRQRLIETLEEVFEAADEIYIYDPAAKSEFRLYLTRDPDAVREIIQRRSREDKERQERERQP